MKKTGLVLLILVALGCSTKQPPKVSELIPIVSITPQYPKAAFENKVEGWVKVKFTITESGRVENPVVINSHPKGIFDRETLRAIRKFFFKPTRVNGKNVKTEATQTIEFKLPKQ